MDEEKLDYFQVVGQNIFTNALATSALPSAHQTLDKQKSIIRAAQVLFTDEAFETHGEAIASILVRYAPIVRSKMHYALNRKDMQLAAAEISGYLTGLGLESDVHYVHRTIHQSQQLQERGQQAR